MDGRKKPWSKEEASFLKENYRTMNFSDIALVLNKSVGQVKYQIRILGVSKSKEKLSKTGDRFGRWVLIEIIDEPGPIRGVAKCECGTIREVSIASLRTGNSVSCGCFRFEVNSIQPGLTSWNTLYIDYKTGAKDRDFCFLLSFEDFVRICSLNCQYCGNEPQLHNKYINKKTGLPIRDNFHKETIDRGWIKKNGIDRVNSLLGYVKENCVPCCSICNEMKMDRKVKEFINHIEKISRHQRSIKNE